MGGARRWGAPPAGGTVPGVGQPHRGGPHDHHRRVHRDHTSTNRDHQHRDRPQRRRHRDDVRDARRDQGPARDRAVPLPSHQPMARRRPQPVDDQGLLRGLRRGHLPHRGVHPRRRRARDPAGHRHRPQPGRVPAARAGGVRDHVAGVLGGRPQGAADDGRVDARGRPRRPGRHGRQHRGLPQRLHRDPDAHPHRRRRARGEAPRRSWPRGTDRSVVFDSIANGVPISVDVDTV